MPTTRHRVTRRLLALLPLGMVVTLAAFGLAGYELYARHRQTNTNQVQNAMVWHAVLCSIEQQTLNDPFASNSAKRAQLLFFDGLLVHDVHTKGCGLRLPPKERPT
jgi:hypothetical protein